MKRLCLILLLVLGACTKKVPNLARQLPVSALTTDTVDLPAPIAVDTVTFNPYKVILKNEDFPELKISVAELAQADALLLKSVRLYNNQQKRLHAQYKDFAIDLRYYVRQYIPQLNKKGEKEVLIYGYCNLNGDKFWRVAPLGVKDGGKCYFTLIVNITKNTSQEIWPNGEA